MINLNLDTAQINAINASRASVIAFAGGSRESRSFVSHNYAFLALVNHVGEGEIKSDSMVKSGKLGKGRNGVFFDLENDILDLSSMTAEAL